MEFVWDTEKHKKKFLAIHVTCSIHHSCLIKKFFTQRIKVPQVEFPVQRSTGRPVARGEERIGSTIPLPMCAGRPSTVNSPAEIPQSSMVGQRRQQISELQFVKFPTPSSFLYWRTRFKKPGDYLFQFSFGNYVMDQRSGDG